MSEENVEIVVGMYENVNARDFAAVMDALADDIVLTLHGAWTLAGGGGAVGKKAVGEWFGDWFSTFDSDYLFEIEQARDFGETEYSSLRHTMRRAG